jgi:hypothetical protein
VAVFAPVKGLRDSWSYAIWLRQLVRRNLNEPGRFCIPFSPDKHLTGYINSNTGKMIKTLLVQAVIQETGLTTMPQA